MSGEDESVAVLGGVSAAHRDALDLDISAKKEERCHHPRVDQRESGELHITATLKADHDRMAALWVVFVGEYLAGNSTLAVDDTCTFQADLFGVFRVDQRRPELGIEVLEHVQGFWGVEPVQLGRLDRVVGDLRAAAQDGVLLDAQGHAALQA